MQSTHLRRYQTTGGVSVVESQGPPGDSPEGFFGARWLVPNGFRWPPRQKTSSLGGPGWPRGAPRRPKTRFQVESSKKRRPRWSKKQRKIERNFVEKSKPHTAHNTQHTTNDRQHTTRDTHSTHLRRYQTTGGDSVVDSPLSSGLIPSGRRQADLLHPKRHETPQDATRRRDETPRDATRRHKTPQDASETPRDSSRRLRDAISTLTLWIST